MKRKLFISGLLMVMTIVPSTAMATNYYLSATGSDTNDGLSATTAFKTLGKVQSTAANGDVVYVSGMIKVDAKVSLEGKQIDFVGASAVNDGFDGQSKTRIFSTVNSTMKFSKLTFTNCRMSERGGAFEGQGGTLTFDDCIFSNNASAGNAGGAIWTTNSTLTLNNCDLYNNKAKAGGAIETRGGNLYISSSSFTGNLAWLESLARDGGITGGALNVVDMSETVIQYSTFDGNVSNMHAGAINITGGGIKKFTIQSCAIVNNMAGGKEGTYTSVSDGSTDYLDNGRTKAHGGALMVSLASKADGADHIYTFASTTIANNSCTQSGGAMLIQGNGIADAEKVNFVNCTITKNETADNIGNSGGITMTDKPCSVNFINTILEGNWSLSNKRWADCWFKSTSVNISNSVIGYIYTYDSYSYTEKDSRVMTTPDANTTELSSGIDTQSTCEGNCFPLASGSYGTTMGDVSLANNYGVSVDQKGQTLTKPYIGAVQLLIGEKIPEVPSVVTAVKTTINHPLLLSIEGNKVSLNDDASVSVYDISGNKIAETFGKSLAINAPKGIYILKIKNGTKVTVRKIIIK